MLQQGVYDGTVPALAGVVEGGPVEVVGPLGIGPVFTQETHHGEVTVARGEHEGGIADSVGGIHRDRRIDSGRVTHAGIAGLEKSAGGFHVAADRCAAQFTAPIHLIHLITPLFSSLRITSVHVAMSPPLSC
jgi:hypothetical protein